MHCCIGNSPEILLCVARPFTDKQEIETDLAWIRSTHSRMSVELLI